MDTYNFRRRPTPSTDRKAPAASSERARRFAGDVMPRPNPKLEFEDDDVEFDDFRIRRPPLAWTTTASVSSVLAWGALAAHNIVTMPKLDGVPNVSFDRITGCARFAPRYVSNVSNNSRRRVASPRAVVARTTSSKIARHS